MDFKKIYIIVLLFDVNNWSEACKRHVKALCLFEKCSVYKPVQYAGTVLFEKFSVYKYFCSQSHPMALFRTFEPYVELKK